MSDFFINKHVFVQFVTALTGIFYPIETTDLGTCWVCLNLKLLEFNFDLVYGIIRWVGLKHWLPLIRLYIEIRNLFQY